MKFKLLTICLFLLIGFLTSCGSARYSKLIEKGKYNKAATKINKKLEKDPDDVELNLMKSELLAIRDYRKYDIQSSYEYYLHAYEQYKSLKDEKSYDKLAKKEITATTFEVWNDSITGLALEDAKAIHQVKAYQDYLDTYQTAPASFRSEAIRLRNQVAFESAKKENTIAAYQRFVDTYPNATEVPEAKQLRNALAFDQAKQKDTIAAYEAFIKKYPEAKELTQAQSRIHEIAFDDAKKAGTADAYKAFIKKYPNSAQYQQAFSLMERARFLENTTAGEWISYKNFRLQYPNNSYVSVAEDSIIALGRQSMDFEIIDYAIMNFSGNRQEEAVSIAFNYYHQDGEMKTLDLLAEKYDQYFSDMFKLRFVSALAMALEADKLSLESGYTPEKNAAYIKYVKSAAPRDRAFLALQQMASYVYKNESSVAAAEFLENYEDYFEDNPKKLKNLIAIYQADEEKVQLTKLPVTVNSKSGSEYVPVVSAKEDLLYFCGQDRVDNIGGEDIFVSRNIRGRWQKAGIVEDLSERFGNEAPEHLSVDGTTMILFKSGTTHISEKTARGWSTPELLPQTINSGDWQADAMISSDGKALLFASVRPDNYNFHIRLSPYHGSFNHQSDIYVSLLNEDGEWGEPMNLGPTINTIYADRSPFLHPDMKTLYFSSNGHGGMGNLDVFMSVREADDCWDCWSEPVNLGKSINSAGPDWGYRITTDGKKAYFSKRDEVGNKIHTIELPDHLRPDYVASLTGTLTDQSGQIVSAAIQWEDLNTGELIGQAKSDPTTGGYHIILPMGKIYGYYVDHPDYFPLSGNLDLRGKDEAVMVEQPIQLTSFDEMIENKMPVPINNLFFKFAESDLLPESLPELRRVAKIIQDLDVAVEIGGHTDNIGSKEKNKVLSLERAESVKNYLIEQGCDEDFLQIEAYGMDKPIADNRTEAGRAKNRRVELKLLKD
ncbi:MAG: OmpA family protein [Cyclobacteriaceae bacterium]|nr:OmpA family protein [Cyclobacteriaceae bacterium]MCH8515327.1 OmpA family protein [Cyclobacteriaceae bacterium]